MEKYCWFCSPSTYKSRGNGEKPTTFEIEEFMKNEIEFEKYENIAKKGD